MEQLNLSFWIGLTASIPLSILGNLLTPRVQQWMAKRSGARARLQIVALHGQLKELERLTSEPGRLQTFLLEGILAITLFTSMLGVLAGLLFVFGTFFPSAGRLFLPMGQLTVIGGAVVVAKECYSTLRKSSQARNIEKSKIEVGAKLGDLE